MLVIQRELGSNLLEYSAWEKADSISHMKVKRIGHFLYGLIGTRRMSPNSPDEDEPVWGEEWENEWLTDQYQLAYQLIQGKYPHLLDKIMVYRHGGIIVETRINHQADEADHVIRSLKK
ncbi:hypothetical protein SAMN05444487_103212 [Marininema mesophilum]|uniref:Uncharacterized protein n=1 Tax=Marininema mesophilum TaxID=1048340 RepID=A0A1H2TQ68_9BACL|nr:hypothetical protein [Marininema mesophilum]SDW46011.1 hypothetical protein SAMN05444487_103212 [Marininema mesophilum]